MSGISQLRNLRQATSSRWSLSRSRISPSVPLASDAALYRADWLLINDAACHSSGGSRDTDEHLFLLAQARSHCARGKAVETLFEKPREPDRTRRTGPDVSSTEAGDCVLGAVHQVGTLALRRSVRVCHRGHGPAAADAGRAALYTRRNALSRLYTLLVVCRYLREPYKRAPMLCRHVTSRTRRPTLVGSLVE